MALGQDRPPRKKSVHWTQTPKGRKLLKAREQKRLENLQKGSDADAISEAVLGYAFGHTQAWLESYADRTKVPGPTLAHRVGKLLQAAAGR